MKKRQRVCKDCGTLGVIRADIKEQDIWVIDVMLCAVCLQNRACLQSIKEDKLPFNKLLAKIRGETDKRIKSEDFNVDVIGRLNKYKGEAVYSHLSQYWVEQLAYVKGEV